MNKSPAQGFTLPELMVTVMVTAILVGIAIPNMSSFIKNGRLSGAANDLLSSLQLARTEAIKRQHSVAVCASADGSTCSYGRFSGWLVFEDTNGNWQHETTEPLIQKHAALNSSVTAFTDNNGIVGYGVSGFALAAGAKVPTRNIAICDSRGNQVAIGTDSVARAVLIDSTGRVRTSKTVADVTTAGNCH